MSLRVESPKQKKDTQDKAEIADPIDNEGFVAGPGIILVLVPESDERVRTQSDTFPTDEHQQHAVAQNQRQHRRGEKIQVREEAPKRLVVVHIAGSINVDQPADAGDDANHDRRERIDQERHVNLERAEVDPGVKIVDQETFFRFKTFENKQRV